MNKTFFIAWLVVFVAWFLGGFLVHGTLLNEDYAQLPNLYRAEEDMQRNFALLILAYVIMAGAFVWIYSRGVEATGWVGQGVRYGIAVALLVTVPICMISYVVAPIPGELVVRQVLFDTILDVVLGLIVAFLYRRPTTATS